MRLVIWHISKYVTPPTTGRVGSRGFLILQELVRMGHRCLMFTSDSNHLADPTIMTESTRMEAVNGVEVHWLRTLKYQGARSKRRMLSWLDFEWQMWKLPKRNLPKPDVVIVSSLSLLSIFNGLLLKRRYGCKLVFEVRDIWPLVLYEEGGYSPKNPFVIILGWIERMAYKHADIIVGTMPNLAPHVQEVLGYYKKVECVPQGVDEDLIDDAEPLPEGYAETYIPKDKFTVCHAGTIGMTNALDTVFECAELMKDNDQVQFLIVGEGYMKAQYQAQCSDLPNVTFAPRVKKPMVQSVLAQCDLLYFAVHPSKVLEYGQSLNKVIDYMLSGRPIVASYSGFRSMINEADSGSYVPANDATALRDEILRYAGMTKEQRDQIGLRGRAWLLEHRRYDILACHYLKILPGKSD